MTEHINTPSRTGSVILDLGEDIGALILDAPAELNGQEIEISRAAGGTGARHTHSLVRERITEAGISYAAVYISVPAGEYVVWRDDDTPAGTVTVRGGEIAHFRWPPAVAG
ncbi:MAG: phospholipase [Actinobacteria bacterium]|nr:phospholipase [Actinomycetota bacterium]